MTDVADPNKVKLSFEEFLSLTRNLADQLTDQPFDAILLLANGGLGPASFLAKMLEEVSGIKKPVLCVTMSDYDQSGRKLAEPIIIEAPSELVYANRTILIIDDVWDTGDSLMLAKKIVKRAGGTPIVAVLHFKPEKNDHPGERPDYYGATTTFWIIYPWEWAAEQYAEHSA